MKIIYEKHLHDDIVIVENNQNQSIFEYSTTCPNDLINELQQMFYCMGFDVEVEKRLKTQGGIFYGS